MPPDPNATRTPTDPEGKRVYGHQILHLTDRLNGAETYDQAAEATDHVLDEADGVLARLGQFFEGAAEQARASETDDGWELAYEFEDAAATLTALSDELHEAGDRMRDLGPPRPPHSQAPTARSFTSALPQSDSAAPPESRAGLPSAAVEVVRLTGQIEAAKTASALKHSLDPLTDPESGVLECVRSALETAGDRITHLDGQADDLADQFFNAAGCLSSAASELQGLDEGLDRLAASSSATAARTVSPAAARATTGPTRGSADANLPTTPPPEQRRSPGRAR